MEEMTGMTKGRYLTKAQMARKLGIGMRTLEGLMNRRQIPFLRFSARLIRFEEHEVENYLQKHLKVHAAGEHR